MNQNQLHAELTRLASQVGDADKSENGIRVFGKFQFGSKVYLKNQTSPGAGTVVAWVVNEHANVDYYVGFAENQYGTFTEAELTDNPKETEVSAMQSFLGMDIDDADDDD